MGDGDTVDDMPEAPVEATIEVDGVQFHLRPVNSRDAALAAGCESVAAARATLLARCATPAAGRRGAADRLPEAARSAISARIAALDPHAEMLSDLLCLECGQSWQGVLEVIHFFWNGVRTEARRLLQEVDALARAYGWRENDILSMSPTRRRLYVQMVLA
jgi:hypothetical protein